MDAHLLRLGECIWRRLVVILEVFCIEVDSTEKRMFVTISMVADSYPSPPYVTNKSLPGGFSILCGLFPTVVPASRAIEGEALELKYRRSVRGLDETS